MARDITEGKLAQRELKAHREHLEELVNERTRDLRQAVADVEQANRSLAYTWVAVENARDGFMFVRVDDASFNFISSSCCEALGYSSKELLRMKVFDHCCPVKE